MEFNKINYIFSLALDQAYQASRFDEVPVGAIITDKHGEIIAKAHNTKEQKQNPCHHAEILAIEQASQKLNSWRLLDCDLYVTLEPCPMCMSALVQSRIKNIYFGAYDPKGGAISLDLNLHQNDKFNHKINTYGGFKHLECSKLLSDFFKQKRRRYK